eukprot:TRINITY_DN21727_c0_g3_i3.p1 TRINITY_DN21727_c0_g3~~TRINITY_DN21727_c0_g3_i3.p1  ORF type:complete len:171 (+),score=18.98 TRINITY_DN21727_c0_g3_i3:25-537(+)
MTEEGDAEFSCCIRLSSGDVLCTTTISPSQTVGDLIMLLKEASPKLYVLLTEDGRKLEPSESTLGDVMPELCCMVPSSVPEAFNGDVEPQISLLAVIPAVHTGSRCYWGHAGSGHWTSPSGGCKCSICGADPHNGTKGEDVDFWSCCKCCSRCRSAGCENDDANVTTERA